MKLKKKLKFYLYILFKEFKMIANHIDFSKIIILKIFLFFVHKLCIIEKKEYLDSKF